MIQVKGLVYAYPGSSTPALRGMDVEIPEGEIFGVLGPSGAGKSTLQKILIGLLKRYRGSVRVMGTEIREATAAYFEQIGVAFEFPNFYHRLTALENLSLFGSMYASSKRDPVELLRQVGLEEAARTRVGDFSKGMKMRLNLCRALLHNPRLLFLDEPTSGLDPANAKRVKDLLREERSKGATILITTHHMGVAEELCDRVAFIVDGEIKLIDEPRNLKIRKGQKRVRVEYRKGVSRGQAEFELNGIGHNEQFWKLLAETEVERMVTLEATLEDVFIEVTGRGLS